MSAPALPRSRRRPSGSVRLDPGRGPRWHLRLAAALAGTAATAGAAGWLLLGSDALAVHRVVVSGAAGRVTPEQVRAAAAVRPGSPLLTVDAGGITRRVGRLPAVADVTVHRDWPHDVRLVVAERQPAAALPADGGVLLVDRSGVGFSREPVPPAGLPVLRGLDATRLAAGQGDRDRLRVALGVLAALPAPVREQVRGLEVDRSGDLVLTLDRGTTVAWGGADRSACKAAALAALLGRPGVSGIDLTDPDLVVTR